VFPFILPKNMEYGIINLAVVPLRAQAKHSSEMVTQLLFGETFEIKGRYEKWLRIISTFDGYEGWLHELQFAPLETSAYTNLSNIDTITTKSFATAALKQADNSILYLPFGATLPFFANGKCTVGTDTFAADTQGDIINLPDIAYSFINSPYQWGGRTHFGVDCSGFSQAVLRTQGVNLLRDAWQQAEQGTIVDFLLSAKLGDLAFFDNEEGRITHVGLMLNNEMIIHASGKVKIEQIDDQGIYSAEQRRYTHKLRIIKRFL
jgi:cell wall-associated NlpC family hydrolase